MPKKRSVSKILFMCCALMAFALLGASITFIQEPLAVYAEEGLEDNLSGTSDEIDMNQGTLSQDDQDVANWIKTQRGMTGKQLDTASKTLSPLTNMLGYLIGGIVCFIFVGVFLITALDILYISFPPVRNILYKAGTDGTGAYTGGYGAGGYGRAGMGMGMMSMGAGGAAGGTGKPTQWVSDEAVQCAALMGGSAQAQGQMGGMMSGYGIQQQPQQPMETKSVIGVYFKKRLIFMIILVVCVLVLTSSALLGTGVNLAKWMLKIVDMINGYIPS